MMMEPLSLWANPLPNGMVDDDALRPLRTSQTQPRLHTRAELKPSPAPPSASLGSALPPRRLPGAMAPAGGSRAGRLRPGSAQGARSLCRSASAAPPAAPPAHKRHAKPAAAAPLGASPAELLMRQMRKSSHAAPHAAAPPPPAVGAGGGARAARQLARCSSSALLAPYGGHANSHGLLGQLGTKRQPPPPQPAYGGSLPSGDFRSEALQLEVRLAEGLQALQDAEQDGEDEAILAKGRLHLFRTLFDRIIERDQAFGVLLRRVKAEYETALQYARQPVAPQLERAQTQLEHSKHECAQGKRELSALQRENAQLRDDLERSQDTVAALREELQAYEAHMYQVQHNQEEAVEASGEAAEEDVSDSEDSRGWSSGPPPASYSYWDYQDRDDGPAAPYMPQGGGRKGGGKVPPAGGAPVPSLNLSELKKNPRPNYHDEFNAATGQDGAESIDY
ncbi:hypothetical protein AB1Y20_014072 [Prymnesium parvum]|uniref:Translin-associated factor X-interacting protein 1 N-terminal domain-containing protein n=1 Tax=Prymnesium parvum TaxID=97485 RepID=A0AB34IIA5_PRYPA